VGKLERYIRRASQSSDPPVPTIQIVGYSVISESSVTYDLCSMWNGDDPSSIELF
jgi:hypothetical protein